MKTSLFAFILLCLSSSLFSEIQDATGLFKDLETARYWDEKVCDRLPLTFNHLLSTGYFTTPSSRMGEGGEIGLGYFSVPPYQHIDGRFQLFSFFELSAAYRIFRHCKDPSIGHRGFGDYADRGANLKLALFTPEDSWNQFPGFAIGVEDFMGSKKFTNYYMVATKVWIESGLETSLGWGTGRFKGGPSQGVFGGLAWFPWLYSDNQLLKGLSLALEYDPIDYTHPVREPHPDGRVQNFPFNVGLKYKLCDIFDFSCGWLRGDAVAYGGSVTYNWGKSKGLLPKINDPLPHTAPRDKEPLGVFRPENVMIQSMAFAFEEQGFRMTRAWIEEGGQKRLWISIINDNYREEHVVRFRVQNLLASLVPSDICSVVVIIETYGLPCQQYVYSQEVLFCYANHLTHPQDLDFVSPREEALNPECYDAKEIFHRSLDPWRGRIGPRFETFFGSSSGKFKYDIGVKLEVEGFLPWDVFYDFQVSYTAFSTLKDVSDFDFFYPSQLPNVLTDYVRYRHQENFSTDRVYLQKNWNLGKGFFAKAALGYFQVDYAGVASEFIYYPANSNLAVGVEGAVLKKRRYTGLGFQNKLRFFKGHRPVFRPYNTLQQAFLSLFWNIPHISMSTKLSAGYFLAGDKGFRLEATRYFESGLRISGWITLTNAKDVMHGDNYFNRGIVLELPLDLFFNCSSRRVWNYGMAAWLRDAGAFIPTGKSLLEMVNRERLDP